MAMKNCPECGHGNVVERGGLPKLRWQPVAERA